MFKGLLPLIYFENHCFVIFFPLYKKVNFLRKILRFTFEYRKAGCRKKKHLTFFMQTIIYLNTLKSTFSSLYIQLLI